MSDASCGVELVDVRSVSVSINDHDGTNSDKAQTGADARESDTECAEVALLEAHTNMKNQERLQRGTLLSAIVLFVVFWASLYAHLQNVASDVSNVNVRDLVEQEWTRYIANLRSREKTATLAPMASRSAYLNLTYWRDSRAEAMQHTDAFFAAFLASDTGRWAFRKDKDTLPVVESIASDIVALRELEAQAWAIVDSGESHFFGEADTNDAALFGNDTWGVAMKTVLNGNMDNLWARVLSNVEALVDLHSTKTKANLDDTETGADIAFIALLVSLAVLLIILGAILALNKRQKPIEDALKQAAHAMRVALSKQQQVLLLQCTNDNTAATPLTDESYDEPDHDATEPTRGTSLFTPAMDNDCEESASPTTYTTVDPSAESGKATSVVVRDNHESAQRLQENMRRARYRFRLLFASEVVVLFTAFVACLVLLVVLKHKIDILRDQYEYLKYGTFLDQFFVVESDKFQNNLLDPRVSATPESQRYAMGQTAAALLSIGDMEAKWRELNTFGIETSAEEAAESKRRTDVEQAFYFDFAGAIDMTQYSPVAFGNATFSVPHLNRVQFDPTKRAMRKASNDKGDEFQSSNKDKHQDAAKAIATSLAVVAALVAVMSVCVFFALLLFARRAQSTAVLGMRAEQWDLARVLRTPAAAVILQAEADRRLSGELVRFLTKMDALNGRTRGCHLGPLPFIDDEDFAEDHDDNAYFDPVRALPHYQKLRHDFCRVGAENELNIDASLSKKFRQWQRLIDEAVIAAKETAGEHGENSKVYRDELRARVRVQWFECFRKATSVAAALTLDNLYADFISSDEFVDYVEEHRRNVLQAVNVLSKLHQ